MLDGEIPADAATEMKLTLVAVIGSTESRL